MKTFITTDDRFFIDESKIEISYFTKEKIINFIYDEQIIIEKIEEAKTKIRKEQRAKSRWWNLFYTSDFEALSSSQLKLLDTYLSYTKEKYFRPKIVQMLYVELDITDIPFTEEVVWVIKLLIRAKDAYYSNAVQKMKTMFYFNTEDEVIDFINDNLKNVEIKVIV